MPSSTQYSQHECFLHSSPTFIKAGFTTLCNAIQAAAAAAASDVASDSTTASNPLRSGNMGNNDSAWCRRPSCHSQTPSRSQRWPIEAAGIADGIFFFWHGPRRDGVRQQQQSVFKAQALTNEYTRQWYFTLRLVYAPRPIPRRLVVGRFADPVPRLMMKWWFGVRWNDDICSIN